MPEQRKLTPEQIELWKSKYPKIPIPKRFLPEKPLRPSQVRVDSVAVSKDRIDKGIATEIDFKRVYPEKPKTDLQKIIDENREIIEYAKKRQMLGSPLTKADSTALKLKEPTELEKRQELLKSIETERKIRKEKGELIPPVRGITDAAKMFSKEVIDIGKQKQERIGEIKRAGGELKISPDDPRILEDPVIKALNIAEKAYTDSAGMVSQFNELGRMGNFEENVEFRENFLKDMNSSPERIQELMKEYDMSYDELMEIYKIYKNK